MHAGSKELRLPTRTFCKGPWDDVCLLFGVAGQLTDVGGRQIKVSGRKLGCPCSVAIKIDGHDSHAHQTMTLTATLAFDA